jgi:hypothetical protein
MSKKIVVRNSIPNISLTRAELTKMLKAPSLRASKAQVSVVFTKKDGTRRTLVGRFGVKKDLVGTGPTYDAESKGLLPIYDDIAEDYRVINLAGLERAEIGDFTFVVNG